MILKKNKIGFIQGRLTKQKNKIQQFPHNNWKRELQLARKLKINLIGVDNRSLWFLPKPIIKH